MVSNTDCRLPDELEMTRNTSDVAVCCSSASESCSRASASSRVRASSCFLNSASELGLLLAVAFVPLERSLRPRIGLLAPSRANVPPSAQSLLPLPVGPAKGQPQPTNPNRTALSSRRLTRSPRRPLFAERDVMEYPASEAASLRLDAGEFDHLGPLFGFVGDQLAKVGRGAGKHRAA